MALANTILTALTAFAALATVWLAYLAFSKARETVDEARAARREAAEAAVQAAADRRSEEHDRQRRRLEHVGELVEDLFWAADLARRGGKVAPDTWISQRNRLGHALVGLHDRLPAATSLLDSATVGQAFGPATRARNEIERELGTLATERASPQP
jgi:hypothetical protein